MVARTARLSAARPARRDSSVYEPDECGEFEAAAGAARITVGPDRDATRGTRSEAARTDATRTDAGLAGANWLSGPARAAARVRRDARRAAARGLRRAA